MFGSKELLNPASDYIFKLIFGAEKNKKLLLSLLNAILKGNPKITNLQLRNSEISKILKDNKTIRLDVKAEINPQEYVDIEIQVQNTGEIIDRAVQCSQNLSAENFRQLSDEEIANGMTQSYKFPKVIGIWILGANVFHDCNEAVTEVGLTRNNHPGFITKKARLFFIELPKFNPKTMDKKNMLDLWMAFFKDPLLTDSKCDSEEIHQAFEELSYVSADQDVRDTYRLRWETEFGHISARNVAIENALEEAEKTFKKALKKKQEKAKKALEEEQKKAEAKAHQEKIESAKSLLKSGVAIEIISTSLGLPLEELQKLG